MKKTFVATLLALTLTHTATAKIVDATIISTPAGVGQTMTAVAVQYDSPLKNVQASDFAIEGRTILDATLVDKVASQAKTVTESHLVLLTLDPNDKDASVTYQAVAREPSIERNAQYHIKQVKAIGDQAPSEIKTSKLINEVADDFIQAVYTDEKTGIKVPYNLYVPKHYDPKKSYPLVMFIHDAGATNSNVKNTLFQGNGATVWAMPENQAKEEIFVLAPQFDHAIVNDQSDDPIDLEPTINLIKSLTQKYNIDKNRLYATGQSGGAMMSLAMNIKYPDFFTASWIVAGQWAPEKTMPIAKNKLFVLVSENDPKAFPTEKAIMKVLTENGAVVKESFGWNAQAPMSELNQKTAELLAQGGNIHFATFAGGSLPLEVQKPENKGSAHIGTWRVAYHIGAIRDWLLSQKK